MAEHSNPDEPTEREAEGLRQLIQLALQIQEKMQEQDPEGFQRMMEAERNKGQQR